MKIDFSSYTIDELFQSLEKVDDELYPENAIEIYTLLLEKLNAEHSEFDLSAYGYLPEDSLFDYMVLLLPPAVRMLMLDHWDISEKLSWKINRVHQLILDKENNNS